MRHDVALTVEGVEDAKVTDRAVRKISKCKASELIESEGTRTYVWHMKSLRGAVSMETRLKAAGWDDVVTTPVPEAEQTAPAPAVEASSEAESVSAA